MAPTSFALAGLVVLAAGCLAQDESLTPLAVDSTAPPTGSGPGGAVTACDLARDVFVPVCSGCHGAGAQTPALDLDGVLGGLVGAASPSRPGRTYVVAGDPDSSFLVVKLRGSQGPAEGGAMPPGRALEGAQLAAIERWVADGASVDCELDPNTLPAPGRYHPVDWAAPAMHGLALKLQEQDCRGCHGAELTGDLGPSCDGCHAEGWRTTCTFCHGGTLDETGAPPRDLTGVAERSQLTFRAHAEHVAERNHEPFDCVECHRKPADVLSVGHVFDATPGRAEVDFSAGRSADGRYEGEGQCSNLYCHGDGRGPNGSYAHTRPRPDCSGCHGGPQGGEAQWDRLSGQHRKHLQEALDCSDCHRATTLGAGVISTPARHVNGQVDIELGPATMQRVGQTCLGTCHGETHDGTEPWFD